MSNPTKAACIGLGVLLVGAAAVAIYGRVDRSRNGEPLDANRSISQSAGAQPCTPQSTSLLGRRAPNSDLEAQLRSNCDGVPELWIVGAGQQAIKVSRLAGGKGVRDNLVWSPKGTLVAFESYDLMGHSPLTTSRVWVVRATGDAIAEVSLPPPNERFSTHIDGWLDDRTLAVRATLLAEDDVLYTFTYDNREVRRNLSSTTP
jgi:hypothetical protein